MGFMFLNFWVDSPLDLLIFSLIMACFLLCFPLLLLSTAILYQNKNKTYFVKRGHAFLITHLVATFFVNIVFEPINLANHFVHDSSFSHYFNIDELLFETIIRYSIYVLMFAISLNIVFRLLFNAVQIYKAKATQKMLHESTFFTTKLRDNHHHSQLPHQLQLQMQTSNSDAVQLSPDATLEHNNNKKNCTRNSKNFGWNYSKRINKSQLSQTSLTSKNTDTQGIDICKQAQTSKQGSIASKSQHKNHKRPYRPRSDRPGRGHTHKHTHTQAYIITTVCIIIYKQINMHARCIKICSKQMKSIIHSIVL